MLISSALSIISENLIAVSTIFCAALESSGYSVAESIILNNVVSSLSAISIAFDRLVAPIPLLGTFIIRLNAVSSAGLLNTLKYAIKSLISALS